MGFYGLAGRERDRVRRAPGRRAAARRSPRRCRPIPAPLSTDPRAALRDAHGSLGWIVPRAPAGCPEDVSYDEVLQTQVPRWSSGRVVLLGDAGQAVSLLGGQGASIGVTGAWLLAERLGWSAAVEEALAGWERVWPLVVELKQRVARNGAA